MTSGLQGSWKTIGMSMFKRTSDLKLFGVFYICLVPVFAILLWYIYCLVDDNITQSSHLVARVIMENYFSEIRKQTESIKYLTKMSTSSLTLADFLRLCEPIPFLFNVKSIRYIPVVHHTEKDYFLRKIIDEHQEHGYNLTSKIDFTPYEFPYFYPIQYIFPINDKNVESVLTSAPTENLNASPETSISNFSRDEDGHMVFLIKQNISETGSVFSVTCSLTDIMNATMKDVPEGLKMLFYDNDNSLVHIFSHETGFKLTEEGNYCDDIDTSEEDNVEYTTSLLHRSILSLNMRIEVKIPNRNTNRRLLKLFVLVLSLWFLCSALFASYYKYLNEMDLRKAHKAIYHKLVSYLCHAIRNPVHSITWVVETLLKEHDTMGDDERNENYILLQAIVTHLHDLANSFIDDNVAIINDVSFVPFPTDIVALARDIYLQNKILYSCDNLEMNLKIDNKDQDITNTYLLVDTVRIRQILLRGYENSFQTTHSGKITLRMFLSEDEAIFNIQLIDSGCGLAGKSQNEIFNNAPFENSSYSLNMWTTRAFAQQMGGNVTLEDRSDGETGSVFTFSLPNKKVNPPNKLFGASVSMSVGRHMSFSEIRTSATEKKPSNYQLKHGSNIDSVRTGSSLKKATSSRDIRSDISHSQSQATHTSCSRDTTNLDKEDVDMIEDDKSDITFDDSVANDFSKTGPSIKFHSGADSLMNADRKGQISKQMCISVDKPKPKINVLFCEDDHVNNLIMQRILGKMPHVCFEGLFDGDEIIPFLESSTEWHPDIIFLDIVMKRMNGDEACRRLRDWGFTGTIVALTGNAMESDRKRYIEAGFSVVVHKPYTSLILSNLILKYTKRNPLGTPLAESLK